MNKDIANMFYNSIYSNNKKERFEIILEPLQAIIQLALLSFCPLNSKLSISNNILYIQSPYWGQSILRKYNNDNREDLFFLFNSIKRFHNFYGYLKLDNDTAKLFELLIKFCKLGINKIIQTYNYSSSTALLHTLKMYIVMLDSPDLHNTYAENCDNNDNDNNNIDNIFINISKIYSKNEFCAIYNILLLLEKNPEDYSDYITCINTLLKPTHTKIKKWINDNIIF